MNEPTNTTRQPRGIDQWTSVGDALHHRCTRPTYELKLSTFCITRACYTYASTSPSETLNKTVEGFAVAATRVPFLLLPLLASTALSSRAPPLFCSFDEA